MSQVLAAFRMGYLSQELRHAQNSVWSGNLNDLLDVEQVLATIDQALLALSPLMVEYQRSTILELIDRIAGSQTGALLHCRDITSDYIHAHKNLVFEHVRQRIARHEATHFLKDRQERNWSDLRTILESIVNEDPRIVPWFEIGDRLGEVIHHRSKDGIITASSDCLAYICAAMGKLSRDKRDRLLWIFPQPYNSRFYYTNQLQGMYRGLCTILTKPYWRRLEPLDNGLSRRNQGAPKEVPRWEKGVIRFRNMRAVPKAQSNSVIAQILDEFERLHWPDVISIPNRRGGDSKQAIYHFNNKHKVVRLSLNGNHVSWHEIGE